ncbi:uncharacterized protein C5orf49 homolog isoform X2 [Felis catus]|uniref:uncharacterized protein C5orf49 homolog isoform X2 n=1 Tax=Felis catus TaxID=9685 RepID=UPI0009483D0D|nr:uncharacterized protein C5orf49 homolog isoform X2 [Felis catus]
MSLLGGAALFSSHWSFPFYQRTASSRWTPAARFKVAPPTPARSRCAVKRPHKRVVWVRGLTLRGEGSTGWKALIPEASPTREPRLQLGLQGRTCEETPGAWLGVPGGRRSGAGKWAGEERSGGGGGVGSEAGRSGKGTGRSGEGEGPAPKGRGFPATPNAGSQLPAGPSAGGTDRGDAGRGWHGGRRRGDYRRHAADQAPAAAPLGALRLQLRPAAAPGPQGAQLLLPPGQGPK